MFIISWDCYCLPWKLYSSTIAPLISPLSLLVKSIVSLDAVPCSLIEICWYWRMFCLHIWDCCLCGILYDLEDGGSMFHWNISKFMLHCVALHLGIIFFTVTVLGTLNFTLVYGVMSHALVSGLHFSIFSLKKRALSVCVLHTHFFHYV